MATEGQLPKYRVAGLMPVEIVGAFEVIDVDQDEGQGLPVAQAPVQFGLDQAFEMRPVPQARQAIGGHQSLQLDDAFLEL